jgi:hypothetical protein
MIEASPLSWPEGWPRTPEARRTHAKFGKREKHREYNWTSKRSLSIADAVARLTDELEKLGVRQGDMIISTNLQLRLDGLPRSGQGEPRDTGVAVYWITKGKPQRVMAVDTYTRVADNLAAIAATLEAMRAIERHGGAQILDRAFTGFLALPASGPAWHVVLGVRPDATADDIREAYRRKAAEKHPDTGGSHAAMAELNVARDEGMRLAKERA